VTEVLVIRLGALGDFILSAGPFAAIRAHHPNARITLLTTRPFALLAEASPWFDRVWIDRRPKLWNLPGLLALRRRLRGGKFDYVYDLQTSSRSSWYFRLMGGAPFWSGVAKGCSHPDSNPERCRIHTLERQAVQLRRAGIDAVPPPDFSWVEADVVGFGLKPPYALLCPGGAPHRPAKRWPAENFAQLAQTLAARGIQPVVLGTGAEQAECAAIAAAEPRTLNLCSRTDLFQIARLARDAVLAVGNDTGPMHLIAASHCPSTVLFSNESDPKRCAPRGPTPQSVTVLQVADLRDLETQRVIQSLPGHPA
jgi:ADP-heptose:LPS heptosyltransferase